jgi:glycine betaine/proline transport system ATP-binding protein
MDIRAVMDIVRQTGNPVGVTENGRLIGQITSDTVLTKLLDPRS